MAVTPSGRRSGSSMAMLASSSSRGRGSFMASSLTGSGVVRCAARPALTLLAVFLLGTSLAGCIKSPRFQAPFTLANANERYPIAVHQGEVSLDLAVNRGSAGLNPSQRAQLYTFLRDYK